APSNMLIQHERQALFFDKLDSLTLLDATAKTSSNHLIINARLFSIYIITYLTQLYLNKAYGIIKDTLSLRLVKNFMITIFPFLINLFRNFHLIKPIDYIVLIHNFIIP